MAKRGYEHMKTGRPSKKARPVPDVETLPCPGRPGPHWLTNHGDVTLCRGCGVTWADLDQRAREGRAA